jgi:hypothetical protein
MLSRRVVVWKELAFRESVGAGKHKKKGVWCLLKSKKRNEASRWKMNAWNFQTGGGRKGGQDRAREWEVSSFKEWTDNRRGEPKGTRGTKTKDGEA